MPRWAICLFVAVVLWVLDVVLSPPYPLNALLWAGVVIAGVLFIVFLILDLLIAPRRGPHV